MRTPSQGGLLVGYARVSSEDQNLDLQRDALTEAGCERTFTDVASGAKDDRAGWRRPSPSSARAIPWSSGSSIAWDARSST